MVRACESTCHFFYHFLTKKIWRIKKIVVLLWCEIIDKKNKSVSYWQTYFNDKFKYKYKKQQ